MKWLLVIITVFTLAARLPAGEPDEQLKNLGSRYLEEREAAVRALAKADPKQQPAMLPALARLLAEGSWFEQSSAVQVLQQLGPAAKPILPEILKTTNTVIAGNDWTYATLLVDVVKAVDPNGFKDLMAALAPLFSDQNTFIRQQSLGLLGRMEPLPSAVGDQLLTMFQDKQVRNAAIEAAGGTQNPSPKLITGLIGVLSGNDRPASIAAAKALARLGPAGKAAVPALANALSVPELTLPAAAALRAIGKDAAAAVPQLMTASTTAPAPAIAELQAALAAVKITNQAPKATDVAGECVEGRTVRVAAAVSDSDDVVQTLTLAIAKAPAHGTAVVEGQNLQYTAKPGFVGDDEVLWTASDGRDQSAPARLRVKVLPDRENPKVLQILATLKYDGLSIVFSKPLAPATAAAAANYQLDQGVKVTGATYEAQANTVLLTTSPLKKDASYRLTVTGVHDLAAAKNAVDPKETTFKATALVPGLTAETFGNLELNGEHTTVIDEVVNFEQGREPNRHGYSVRWTGKVKAQHTEKYVFVAKADDGVRLWVNGKQLVDAWKDQAPTEYAGELELQAGELYDLKLEFYERGGGQCITLAWESKSTPRQIIPKDCLFTLPLPGN